MTTQAKEAVLELVEGEVSDNEETLTPSQVFKALTKSIDKINDQLKAVQAQRNGETNE